MPRLHWKIYDQVEERKVFDRFEKFLGNSIYSIAQNSCEFSQIRFTKKRLAIIIFLKILCIFLGIRCVLNILWPTPYIRDLTCNSYHYLGNQVLINMVFLGGAVSADLTLGITHVFLNLTGSSHQYNYLSKIRNYSLYYGLSGRFRAKYFRYFDYLLKVCSTQFVPNWLIFTVIYCFPTIFGYFSKDLNFNLFGLLLFYFQASFSGVFFVQRKNTKINFY